MRIAVAYENGEIYGHFGHCPMFAVYEYGEYVHECEKKLVDTSALSGHQAMADKMRELDVDAVICGNIGEGSMKALRDAGILFYGGVVGDADEAITALIAGGLKYDPDIRCAEHDDCSCGGDCASCGDCGGGSALRLP